jgi:hypothetical protein
MKQIFLVPFLALAATAALAGPYDQPYSQVMTERKFPSADPNVIPVIVNRIDDVTVYDRYGTIAPGMHQVTVDVPPRNGYHTATQVTFPLETKACQRYYVAARLKSRTLQEWEPFIRFEEQLKDCSTKFNLAQGK